VNNLFNKTALNNARPLANIYTPSVSVYTMSTNNPKIIAYGINSCGSASSYKKLNVIKNTKIQCGAMMTDRFKRLFGNNSRDTPSNINKKSKAIIKITFFISLPPVYQLFHLLRHLHHLLKFYILLHLPLFHF